MGHLYNAGYERPIFPTITNLAVQSGTSSLAVRRGIQEAEVEPRTRNTIKVAGAAAIVALTAIARIRSPSASLKAAPRRPIVGNRR